MRRMRLWIPCLCACTWEAPQPGTLQYDGDNLEVWASEGLTACGGTYPYMDTWIDALRGTLGMRARRARTIYSWVDADDYEATPCGRNPSNGCTVSGLDRVYTKLIPLEHELVHVALDPGSASLLAEGVAEMFGSRVSLADEPSVHPIADLLDRHDIPGTGYETAGRFARYVSETHGLAQLLDVFDAAPRDGGRAGIEAAVTDVLGEALDTVIEDFEAEVPCSTAEWRVFDYECRALAPIPWVRPTRWEARVELDCGRDDVIGPRLERIWALRAFEVAEAGDYWLSSTSAEDVTVTVVPCGLSCYDDDSRTSVSFHEVSRMRMDPGRHWIRVEGDARAPTSVDLAIGRMDD